MQPVITTAPWLVPALPFISAAVTFFLAGQIRRIASYFSKKYLETEELKPSVPPNDASDSRELSNPKPTLQRLPEALTSPRISALYAKNGEGSDALVGMIALVSLALNSGVIQSQLSGIFVAVGMAAAFLAAGLLWTKDPRSYRAGRLNLSQTGWGYVILNLAIGGLFIYFSVI